MGVFTTTPRTAVIGGLDTAADYNTYEKGLADAFGAMSSWTPTWTAATTNPVLGNGTFAAGYTQVGKTVLFRIRLTMGSTTTYGSGVWRFSFPVPPIALFSGASDAIGYSSCYDTSGAARRLRFVYPGATTYMVVADQDGAAISSTVPWTWASGDTLSISGWYEAA